MSDYRSETWKMFTPLIQKPKMAEQLLKKPPPKYIYDIILNTMKVSGFPKINIRRRTQIRYHKNSHERKFGYKMHKYS